jgi:hypothetical protein
MNKIGTVDIPKHSQHNYNSTSHKVREALSELTPGKADVYEFETVHQARRAQVLISNVAKMQFGKTGQVSTSVVENTIFVWLREPEIQK